MSIAEQKRTKQTAEALTSHLNRTLVSFKNAYLGDFVKWNISQIESQLAFVKENKTTVRTERDILHLSKYYEGKLENLNLLTLEFITDAAKNYELKLAKLVDSMIKHGIKTAFLRVQKISNTSKEFAFLISDKEIEIHARAVYCCGEINAPHYRFITTKRSLK